MATAATCEVEKRELELGSCTGKDGIRGVVLYGWSIVQCINAVAFVISLFADILGFRTVFSDSSVTELMTHDTSPPKGELEGSNIDGPLLGWL